MEKITTKKHLAEGRPGWADSENGGEDQVSMVENYIWLDLSEFFLKRKLQIQTWKSSVKAQLIRGFWGAWLLSLSRPNIIYKIDKNLFEWGSLRHLWRNPRALSVQEVLPLIDNADFGIRLTLKWSLQLFMYWLETT